ncbi:hypothetical protein [Modicisalibacter xianhensis]|uniref:Uncharacterized protein n=1 Tax=Modicisalibacter xianhensis TaxID=442341 RepID=A0A1I3EQS1_9GAMM|nr:hypothetical protein [Halomonas xianhensis]SFI01337.1 hypothetical protein SAMN04487959_114118 [Halomonas xianhensis]
MTLQAKASAEVVDVIQRLAEGGISFSASHDGPAGKTTVTLTPKQLELFWCDPAAAFASVYGVSRSEYIAWHESGYMVRCSELTSKGKRCRNAAVDAHLVPSPDRWVAMQGGYCKIHSEGWNG